jgi:hypothetical protein
MSLRERFDECAGRIKFNDLDIATRSVAVLWLETFMQRVIRNCFPNAGSKSLLKEISDLINSVYFEGYLLAKALEEPCGEAAVVSNPALPGSVEASIDKLRLMYENDDTGHKLFEGQPQGVQSFVEAAVREIAYGPQLMWLEERELLKVHFTYAMWGGYRLAQFEKTLARTRSVY